MQRSLEREATRRTLFRGLLLALVEGEFPLARVGRRQAGRGSRDQFERFERVADRVLELGVRAFEHLPMEREVDLGRVIDPADDALGAVASELLDLDLVLRDVDVPQLGLLLVGEEPSAPRVGALQIIQIVLVRIRVQDHVTVFTLLVLLLVLTVQERLRTHFIEQ